MNPEVILKRSPKLQLYTIDGKALNADKVIKINGLGLVG